MKLRTKFEDEDFELGEVVDAELITTPRLKVTAYASDGGKYTFFYTSKSEFDEDWEDTSEGPKKYWFIYSDGEILNESDDDTRFDRDCRSIGNYFETEEEAKKAVEKLEAFKRLKDKGFRFDGHTDDSGDLFSCQVIRCRFDDFGKESRKDLDLLFGGEE